MATSRHRKLATGRCVPNIQSGKPQEFHTGPATITKPLCYSVFRTYLIRVPMLSSTGTQKRRRMTCVQ